jgi:hypothetical protein
LSAIGPLISLSVPDIDAVLEDYESIQLERAASYGGSYALVTTITLVADDTEYSYRDASGVATSYYRYRYYHSTGPVASSYSEPFAASFAPTTTRQELRQRAAYRLGAGQAYGVPPTEFTFPGPSGTTTGAGSTTTIVCSTFASSSFMDTGSATASKVFDGWFIRITSGAQAGTERRVADAGLNESNGTFTVSPAWAGAPGSGVTFELYGCGLSSSEWDQFLDAARVDLWYPTEVVITGVQSQTEYPLPYWIEREDQILGLAQRTGATLAQHRYDRGYEFQTLPQEGGGVVLYLPGGISANSVWTLECQRHPAPFTSDTAAVPLAEQYQKVWWLTAAMRAAQAKAQSPLGMTEQTKFWGERFKALSDELDSFVSQIGWKKQAPARRRPMVAVGGGVWGGGSRGAARSAYY